MTGTNNFEKHLLDGEDVSATFDGSSWTWVSTDRRLLKHRMRGSGEEFEDISYDEISGIGLTHVGRNENYARGAGVMLLLAILPYFVAIGTAPGLSALAVVVAAGLLYVWWNSEASYFEFKGSGLIQQNPEAWRIDQTSVDNQEALTEFVQTVRSEL